MIRFDFDSKIFSRFFFYYRVRFDGGEAPVNVVYRVSDGDRSPVGRQLGRKILRENNRGKRSRRGRGTAGEDKIHSRRLIRGRRRTRSEPCSGRAKEQYLRQKTSKKKPVAHHYLGVPPDIPLYLPSMSLDYDTACRAAELVEQLTTRTSNDIDRIKLDEIENICK